jgi:hypothetical protein
VLCLLAWAGPAAAGPPTFSSAWRPYVAGRAVHVGGLPATLHAGEHVDLDFGRELSGRLALSFGIAEDALVSVSFSETSAYLGFESDHWRGLPTDDHLASPGETWVDTPGCQVSGVCSEGQRAFRYARVALRRGTVELRGATVALPPSVREADAYDGWFLSSDELLNRIWYASVYTAELVTDVYDGNATALGGCESWATGRVVLFDGAKRDRCPAVGDLAVSGPTLLVSSRDASPLLDTLELFAQGQRDDGAIPSGAGAVYGGSAPLFDYSAWWVVAVWNAVLATGDRAFAERSYRGVARVLDEWYPLYLGSDGLLANPFGASDYAYIRRGGQVVAYHNALYAVALRDGARLAAWLGRTTDWAARADGLARRIDGTFWDGQAYRDSTEGKVVHPQDGNALAILAGAAPLGRARDALAYLARANARPWGNTIADNDAWDRPEAAWGDHAQERVYPFVSYFEVLARFAAGDDAGAYDLIRRGWGWMIDPAHAGPGTMWEALGSYGSIDGFQKRYTSMAHGWSTGAAPALTAYALGIRATSPGFATFDAAPRTTGLAWAQGQVPTPHGPIRFAWSAGGARIVVPPGTRAHVVLGTIDRTLGPGTYVLQSVSKARPSRRNSSATDTVASRSNPSAMSGSLPINSRAREGSGASAASADSQT